MRVKHALMTTAAAVLMTAAGFAQAQQSAPSGRDAAKPAAPPAASSQSAPSSAAMPGGAAGQGALQEIDKDKAQGQAMGVSAKDLSDMDIYGSDGKKIGEVNKLLADSSSQVKAVTVDVGGFLGMGSREVVIPLDKLQKGQDNKRLQTSMTKTEIEKLAEWKDPDKARAPRRDATPNRAPATAPDRAPPANPPSR